jgi:hypothetical protein
MTYAWVTPCKPSDKDEAHIRKCDMVLTSLDILSQSMILKLFSSRIWETEDFPVAMPPVRPMH